MQRLKIAAALLFIALLSFPTRAYCRDSPLRFKLATTTIHGGLKTAVPAAEKNRPRLALALSGGGARAAASIGVLKVLTENGIPVSAVAGTSMGALVGGLYASGYQPDEIEKIFLSNDWNTVFNDTPIRAFLTQQQKEGDSRHLLEFAVSKGRFVPPTGLSAGQKLATVLMTKTAAASFWADRDFNRLIVPFRAVATDIETGAAVILDRGLVHEAVRASVAIPLVFQPVEIGGKLLVDGGLSINLPVDAARSLNADIVLAVDCSTRLEKKEKLTSLFEIMNQSISIQVRRETEDQAARADLVLAPDVSRLAFTDFPAMKEIIGKGEEAARAALPRILKLMKPKHASPGNNKSFRITSLTIRGNVNIPEEKIRDAMAKAFPLRELSAHDIQTAMAEVFNLGYFSDLSLDLEHVGRDYRAVLTVSENDRVDEIKISGTSIVSEKEIIKDLNFQFGQVLNTSVVSAALDKIVERCRKEGYALVRVAHAGMIPGSGILEITIDEGRVEALALSDKIKTKPSLIRREIRTAVGRPLNFHTLEQDIHHLYALDYFESLTIDLSRGPAGGIVLVFKIREKVNNRVRFGLRYDLEDSFTGLTDIVFNNLTGRGFKLYLNTRYGNYLDLTLGYHSPVFLRTNFVHTIQAFYRQRNYFLYENKDRTNEIEVRRIGGEVAFGYQWFRFGDTYLRYRYETDRTVEVIGPSPPKNNVQVGSLAFLTTIDTRDSSTFPHKGILLKGSYENAQRAYGSTDEFVKTSAYVQGNLPLGERHTVVAESTVGIGSGIIPYQEQYGIGGADYLLGFPLLGYNRREFTGPDLLGFTLAYRYKIIENQLKAIKAVYVRISGQAANVWNKRDELSINDLRTGVGLGVHADTIIGPARLDLAAGEGDRRAVYFSMGFDF